MIFHNRKLKVALFGVLWLLVAYTGHLLDFSWSGILVGFFSVLGAQFILYSLGIENEVLGNDVSNLPSDKTNIRQV